MKKILLIFIILVAIISNCGTKEVENSEETTIEEEMNEIEKEIELVFGKTPTINYSNDRAANQFIERYNELNPENIITEDMVICPDNSDIYLTIIEFEYMDFCISECDGEPSYRCESILEFNDENTNGFFNEVFCVIQAVEEKLSDEEIGQLLLELRNGDYPYNNYVSPKTSSRGFSFTAPDHINKLTRTNNEHLTYDLYWNHSSY